MPSARRRHPKTSPFVTRNIAPDCPTTALESNACARPIVRATGKRFKRVQQFPPVPRPHCLACGDAMLGRIDGASHFQNDAKGLRNDLSCIRLRHILPGAGAHMAGGMNGSTLAHSSSIRSRPHHPPRLDADDRKPYQRSWFKHGLPTGFWSEFAHGQTLSGFRTRKESGRSLR